RVQIFEIDGLAAERSLQSDLVKRLVLDDAGAGAQVRVAAHRAGNACDVDAPRSGAGRRELRRDIVLLRAGQRGDEAADVYAVERGVERDVVCAHARDVQRELRVAAVGLREFTVGDARRVRVRFNRSG